MNDRYLFKAKRTDNEEWVQGYYFQIQESGYILLHIGNKILTDEIDISTLCQCTGLKDKNGKLIWENDIVKCVDKNNDIGFMAIVEFGNPNGLYSWGYQLRHIKGDEPNLDILLWIDMEEAGATCKVIGNRFDNPDLLEECDND